MDLAVGAIVEGKVTGITKFGAFVALPAPRGRVQQAPKDPSTMSFEDKLKAFMSDSESRQADVRHATDRKNGSRRRR